METIRREPSLHGEIGLWLVILFDVIEALRKEPESRQDQEDRETARRFIQERGWVFEHAAEFLGFEAERFRRRMMKLSASYDDN